MRLEALAKMSIVPAGGQKVQNKIARGIGDSLAVMQKRHKQHEIIKGGKGAPQPGKWTKRGGVLSKSFHINWNKGDLSGTYGSDLKRSRIIEEGGTIKAKGKKLTIPVDKKARGKSAKDFPDLFFYKSTSGKAFLAQPDGGDNIELLFILLSSVKLPPRPTLANAAKNSAADRERIMGKALIDGVWSSL